MNIERRSLVKLATFGIACIPFHSMGTQYGSGTTLRTMLIPDSSALPLLAPGNWLLVDTAITRFAGDGLYLYPARGQPRAYLLTCPQVIPGTGETILEFRNPATRQLLWTQSLEGEMDFAGKVCGQVEEVDVLTKLQLMPLKVPGFQTSNTV